MRKYICLTCCFFGIFLFLSNAAYAQKEERKNIREGNKLYEKKKYKEAEDAYRKALDVNSQSLEGIYNTGNSLYRQINPPNDGQFSEEDQKRINTAIDQYKAVAALSQNKMQKAKAWHNLGNIHLITGNFQQSVDAYKKSLLNNPSDNETRYNYALAKALLQQQQQNQDKNKDKNDKNQDKDQDKNNDQNQDQDKDKQDQNQNNEQQQDKISKEQVQQILDAIMQDEKQTQEKVQKAKKIQQKKQPEKDW